MPETSTRLTWARVSDRNPDATAPDSFIALNGEEEVGVVKRIEVGPDEGRWLWSMLLTHPGPAFNRPTNGTCEDRLEAVRELHECWWAFRKWFGIAD
jgi:hypothetical protein